MSINIDKNVPLSLAPNRGSRFLDAGQTWADVAKAMAPGDSFELELDHKQSTSVSTRQNIMKHLKAALGSDARFASRTTKGGYRFWRVY